MRAYQNNKYSRKTHKNSLVGPYPLGRGFACFGENRCFSKKKLELFVSNPSKKLLFKIDG